MFALRGDTFHSIITCLKLPVVIFFIDRSFKFVLYSAPSFCFQPFLIMLSDLYQSRKAANHIQYAQKNTN